MHGVAGNTQHDFAPYLCFHTLYDQKADCLQKSFFTSPGAHPGHKVQELFPACLLMKDPFL